MSNPGNAKSKLHAIWKALMGDVPPVGTKVRPAQTLPGKVALCTVFHRTTERGGTFSSVSTVVAPPQTGGPPRRPRHPNPTPAYMPAAPSDDLADA